MSDDGHAGPARAWTLSWSPGRLAAEGWDWTDGCSGGRVRSAGAGPARPSDFAQIAGALRRGGDPGHTADGIPWVVAVERDNGDLAIAASTVLASSFFWGIAGQGDETRVIATGSPRDAVSSLGSSSLDSEYFARSIRLDIPVDRTPFVGVTRATPGTTLVWSASRSPARGTPPRVIPWCHPDGWPRPFLAGADAITEYLGAFDASIDQLRDAAGSDLVVMMSAGLDSTFIAGSVVAGGTANVRGLVHSPLPDAQIDGRDGMPTDEFPRAGLMEAFVPPGRIRLERLRNESRITPLAGARTMSDRAWIPVPAPENAAWIIAAEECARTLGAPWILSGGHGNVSFSSGHGYAAAHELAHGKIRASQRALEPPRTLRARLSTVRRAIGWPRRPDPYFLGMDRYAALLGLGPFDPAPESHVEARRRFLRALANHTSGAWAVRNAGFSAVASVDPFRARRVLDAAAAIAPHQWQQGPPGFVGSRRFARILAAGRTPTELRLGPFCSCQGRDAWFVTRNDRAKYFNEIEEMSATPIVRDLVDAEHLRRIVARWPWGQVHGPTDEVEFIALTRVLHLAQFVRDRTNDLDHMDAPRASPDNAHVSP